MTAEAEVRSVVEGWMTAIRRRDLDAVCAGRAENVVFYDVPAPVESRGMEAYRRSWDEFLRWVTAFDTDDLEVYAGEDVAFCHCIVRCAGETEPQGFPVRLTIGLRKIDGRWQVTHEHHSVPAASG